MHNLQLTNTTATLSQVRLNAGRPSQSLKACSPMRIYSVHCYLHTHSHQQLNALLCAGISRLKRREDMQTINDARQLSMMHWGDMQRLRHCKMDGTHASCTNTGSSHRRHAFSEVKHNSPTFCKFLPALLSFNTGNLVKIVLRLACSCLLISSLFLS